MPFQVSPGVNVSEIDLTTVVPAVSTTEGAIAGQFRWGPVEDRVLVDSEDRLVSIFQKPNTNNAVDFFTAGNFLAYGNALNIVRVLGAGANNASESASKPVLIKNENSVIPFGADTCDDNFYAKYPGVLGNSLKLAVCASSNGFSRAYTTEIAQITTNTNVVTIDLASDADVDTKLAQIQIGDTIAVGTNQAHESTVTGISSQKDGEQTAGVINVVLTIKDTYYGETIAADGVAGFTRKWEYASLFDGAPDTSATATSRGGSTDEMHFVVVDEDGLISGTKGGILETYSNLSKAVDSKTAEGAGNYFRNVINQQSPFLAVSGKTFLGSTGLESADNVFTAGESTITSGVKNISFVGGTDGNDLTGANKIIGYDLFKSAEDVDVSFLLGGNADLTLATYLITNIAEHRKDCIVVLSPEYADVVNNNSYPGKEVADVIAFRDSLPSSSYAVLDGGWKYQYDKYNDVYRYIPLNADTAGLMVQTDTTRDPWFSPAGFNRGNVKNAIKLAYNPTKGDRDALYKKGINPVVTFPGQGTILFGDKTLLAKPSAFDRINVRRLFIVLEKAISTASKFTLFEFNDEFTRSQFKNLVEPFLRDVQGRRGITDFVVVCDGTNNTGEVVDRNEFIGDIYIKPARSINFIQLNFVAVRSGVEFSEIVGRA